MQQLLLYFAKNVAKFRTAYQIERLRIIQQKIHSVKFTVKFCGLPLNLTAKYDVRFR
jgi:hypothetical protein